ncbi:MAG: class I SAM-dependent methyltransferase [Bacteroidetes bacterium]|nr:class I SAM-dependent methyltransferase [Bacteroidota bacterium]
MKIYRLKSLEEYIKHVDRNQQNYAYMRDYEKKVTSPRSKKFTVRGISYPANRYVDFQVDYLHSDGVNINWRERLICPVTGLNNRLRCSLQLMDMELNPYPEDIIYITEQVTPLFGILATKYKNLIGSEFLGPDVKPGQIINDVRHEDMTNLSLQSSSVHHYLSFECFEHIPEYKKAIPEIYRVLKPGGTFLGSFPFDINAPHNFIKAKIENGETIYLTEPEYHGDPVNAKGILCYTIFGWEMLEELRQTGFKDVYAILIWSDIFSYLGGEQVFFIAKK